MHDILELYDPISLFKQEKFLNQK